MKRARKLRRNSESMLSRDKAFDLLMPLVDDYLLPAVQVGIEMMALLKPKQRRPLSKRTLAGMLNDYIVDDVGKRLSDVRGVEPDSDLGFQAFIVGGLAVVRIKKVNKRGRYSNYPTKQQVELLYQRMLPGIEVTTQVIFGYRLDELWREIKEVSFVCWNGNRRHWEIPVADDLQSYLPVIAEEELQRRESLVRPKVGKRRRKQSG